VGGADGKDGWAVLKKTNQQDTLSEGERKVVRNEPVTKQKFDKSLEKHRFVIQGQPSCMRVNTRQK